LSNRQLGATGGSETVTLTQAELAAHTHTAVCSTKNGDSYAPADNYWAIDAAGGSTYAPAGSGQMAAAAFGKTGYGEVHENRQPYLAVTYGIATVGIYPNRY
jgi:microcystin-dependent protein